MSDVIRCGVLRMPIERDCDDLQWEQFIANCHEAATQLEQRQDEIERLQAIVDRLPKTADGSPILPGQVVYHRDRRGKIRPETMVLASPFPHLLKCCYSTREAAEAAKGK